jgi:nicotinate (nicotinamide) nucleotide adenylyltransferase
MMPQFATPLDKLRPPAPGWRPVLLVFNGTFCPVHNNHLRMLEVARAWAEQRLGWSVVGGYLTVSHDSSCARKLGSEFCPAEHRLEMCRLATASSDWIMVDPFQASQPINPGAHATLTRLEALVTEALGVPVTAIPVCGGDLLPRLAREFGRGVMCVLNRSPAFDLDSFLTSSAVGPHRNKIVLVEDLTVPPLSSTQVRALVRRGEDLSQVLPEAVIRYHQEHQIRYGDPGEPLRAPGGPTWAELQPYGCLLVELGRGIEAVVYAATWEGQPVAVKVWELTALGGSARRKKIEACERERRLLGSLSHDNILGCYGGSVEDERAFLVLERASGPLWPLRTADGVLPLFPDARWLSALRDVARAMTHVAANGIVHRDLTVQNLLYTDGPDDRFTVKLSDFSLAKRLDDPCDLIRGSLRHYPPEAINKVGRDYYTEKADVFMFGYLIHDLAHGAPVWQREDTPQAVAQTLAGRRPEVTVPCVPELVQLMAACWSQQPWERPTFREVLECLERMPGEWEEVSP